MEEDIASIKAMYREIRKYYVVAQRNYEQAQDTIRELMKKIEFLEAELVEARNA